MKKNCCCLLLLLFACGFVFSQRTGRDSTARQRFVHAQTIKADTLNQLAMRLATPGADRRELDQAIEYIMKGLPYYSRYRDSTGLRKTFDHLAFVYNLQKKYIQAKWFYIQSNTISRERRDTANIIKSLEALAGVKTEINDPEMAHRDMNEALAMAKEFSGIRGEVAVESTIANIYTKKGDAKKAAKALTKVISLKDSLYKADAQKKQAQIDQQAKQQQQTAQEVVKEEQVQQVQEDQLHRVLFQKDGITYVAICMIALITALVFRQYLKRRVRKKRKKVAGK